MPFGDIDESQAAGTVKQLPRCVKPLRELFVIPGGKPEVLLCRSCGPNQFPTMTIEHRHNLELPTSLTVAFV